MHVILPLSQKGLFRGYSTYTQIEPPRLEEILPFNLTQFSQRHKMLGAAAPNFNGFLWTDRAVSSTEQNRLIAIKMMLSAP